jgi:hypothetical protein
MGEGEADVEDSVVGRDTLATAGGCLCEGAVVALEGGGGSIGKVDCGSRDDCVTVGAGAVEVEKGAAGSITDIVAPGSVAVEGRDPLLIGDGVEQANKSPQRSRRTTKTAPPLKLAAMLTGALPSWYCASSSSSPTGLATSPADHVGKREGEDRDTGGGWLMGAV